MPAEEIARALRALVPTATAVRAEVEPIVDAVRGGGDQALRDHVERFDGWNGELRVSAEELEAAEARLPGDVRAGLLLAMANVSAVASASLGEDAEVLLPQGQRILMRELPVGRAGIYVPGGRAPYPSTVVMGVAAAQVAGVEEIVVCAPRSHETILAACSLCGVGEVYRMGGAHAVAALAYGTETIPRVDVVAGPGGLYVQEAKRLVSGDVGIDGFLGPSDVLVLAAAGSDPQLVALDLLAQAEHGEGTIVVAASPDQALLDSVEARVRERLSSVIRWRSDGLVEMAGGEGAVAALVDVADVGQGLELAEAFAPEHLELVGPDAEALAPRVRHAGCVFVGATGATAFGDYVAGSNHSLPTGGAARFASALSPRAFRRRMAEVHVGRAAVPLARAAAPVARAEGFEVHAASMEARTWKDQPS